MTDRAAEELGAIIARQQQCIAELENAIHGHCALLLGHSDHTGNVTDCLGEVLQRVEDLRESLRWLLRMVAMVPERDLPSLIVDPYGCIGDALESIGLSREPDSWTALMRFAGFPDPGPVKARP